MNSYCGWILLLGYCFVEVALCGEGAICIIKSMPSGYAYTYSPSWKTQSFGSFGRRSQNIKKGLSNSLESPCLVWFWITHCSQTHTTLPRTALIETSAGSYRPVNTRPMETFSIQLDCKDIHVQSDNPEPNYKSCFFLSELTVCKCIWHSQFISKAEICIHVLLPIALTLKTSCRQW